MQHIKILLREMLVLECAQNCDPTNREDFFRTFETFMPLSLIMNSQVSMAYKRTMNFFQSNASRTGATLRDRRNRPRGEATNVWWWRNVPRPESAHVSESMDGESSDTTTHNATLSP